MIQQLIKVETIIQMEMKTLFLACISSLFLLSTSHAAVEVTVAGGPNWLNTNDTEVVISSFETDEVLVNQIANSPLWKVGVGYPIFENNPEKNHFLKRLLLELNLYHTHGTFKGDVWQFELPEFNNYGFQAPFTSTRLMLDLKPVLLTYREFSTYIIVGIGVTSNTLEYKETVTEIGVDPNSALSLEKERQYKFAYEAGLGLRAAITQHLNASLEYLYASLGNNSPSDNSGGVQMAEVPTFKIRSQSGLFGLTWIF